MSLSKQFSPEAAQITFYPSIIDEIKVQVQQRVLQSGGCDQHGPDYWSHKSLVEVVDPGMGTDEGVPTAYAWLNLLISRADFITGGPVITDATDLAN